MNKKVLRIAAVCILMLIVGAVFYPQISSFLSMRVPGVGYVGYVSHPDTCYLMMAGEVRKITETDVIIEKVSIVWSNEELLDDIEAYLGCPLSEAVFVSGKQYFEYEYDGEHHSEMYPVFMLQESWPVRFYISYYEDERPEWNDVFESDGEMFRLSGRWDLAAYNSEVRAALFTQTDGTGE